MDWAVQTLAKIFIGLLDNVAYALLSLAYCVFLAVAGLNIFKNEGELIYNQLITRVYSIIAVVMVFFFAYQLILLIINPDRENKASSGIIKNTIISFAFIAFLPTIFNYMMLFQNHVLADNTIPKIVLGDTSASRSPSKSIAMNVFFAFYHPKGTDTSTFYDENGNLLDRQDAVDKCRNGQTGKRQSLCETYYDSLSDWYDDQNSFWISPIATNEDLSNRITDEDGMEYFWIISTACAVVAAFFFISYAIAVGTRAIKLGVLQLVAPIPMIMRIFPQTKKTFDTWFKELLKTYAEVFLRVALISFIVYLCTLVPTFVRALIGAGSPLCEMDGSCKGLLVAMFAVVAVILGLLKFAKDAPELIKKFGGDAFAGLDLNPKSIMKEAGENAKNVGGKIGNVAAIGAAGIGGTIGRGVSTFRRLHNKSLEYDQRHGKNSGSLNRFGRGLGVFAGTVGSGLIGGLSGMVRRGRSGQGGVLQSAGGSYRANRRHGETSLGAHLSRGAHNVADNVRSAVVDPFAYGGSAAGAAEDLAALTTALSDSEKINDAITGMYGGFKNSSDMLKSHKNTADQYDFEGLTYQNMFNNLDDIKSTLEAQGIQYKIGDDFIDADGKKFFFDANNNTVRMEDNNGNTIYNNRYKGLDGQQLTQLEREEAKIYDKAIEDILKNDVKYSGLKNQISKYDKLLRDNADILDISSIDAAIKKSKVLNANGDSIDTAKDLLAFMANADNLDSISGKHLQALTKVKSSINDQKKNAALFAANQKKDGGDS